MHECIVMMGANLAVVMCPTLLMLVTRYSGARGWYWYTLNG